MKNVISIDFDETIYDNKNKEVINKNKINKLFENPDNFIAVYTSRSYSQFELIRRILINNEVKFHALICEKIRADVYIDDKNNGGIRW